MPDKAVASLLNREGKKTGRLNGWTQSRVCTFRNQHGIAIYRAGERAARDEVTLNEAADQLGCCAMTALRMIREGVLAGKQHCKGAPWIISRKDVEALDAGDRAVKRAKRPLSSNPDQQPLPFNNIARWAL